jgi:chemotaxis protein methyltransferase CheR
MDTTISIINYKDIISAIKSTYGIDFSQYAMGSLNRNISYLMKSSKYSSVKLFINGLKNDKRLFERFLSCIYCEHISLFRDPAMWRILKQDVLDKILVKKPLRIWIPEVSLGSEYYSLLIYLHQQGLINNSKIIISDISHNNLELCRRGNISPSIIANSESNFKRIDENNDLYKYIEKKDNSFFIKKEFLKNTFIYKNSIEDIKLPYKPNLVLFRNKLIYYTHVREQKVINLLHKNMEGGGFLITGVKENIGMFDIDKKFKLYNEDEQIYKRHF